MFRTPPSAKESPQTCKVCEQPESGSMVYCDTCNDLFHYECVGVDKSIESSLIPWNCTSCDAMIKASERSEDVPTTTTSIETSIPSQNPTWTTSQATTTSNTYPQSVKVCHKCCRAVWITQDQVWSGFCAECNYVDNVIGGSVPSTGAIPKSSRSILNPNVNEFNNRKRPSTIRQKIKCDICLNVFSIIAKEGEKIVKVCSMCSYLSVNNQRGAEKSKDNFDTRSKSSTGSTRRKKELQLSKLEEQHKLNMTYLERKYEIMNESDSQEDVFSDEGEERTQDWFQGQKTFQSDKQLNRGHATNRTFTSVNNTMHRQPTSSTTFPQYNHASRSHLRNPSNTVVNRVLTKEHIASRHTFAKEEIKFDGNPLNWPSFIIYFTETMNLCNFSDAENLLRLRRCLEGDAHAAVEHRLYVPNSVDGILTTLRLLFGRPQMIIKKLLEKVGAIPKVNQEKFSDLINFSLAVQNLCATMSSTGLESHLNNPQLLQDLLNKLPATYKMDWSKFKRTNGFAEFDINLETFSDWLSILAEDASEYNEFEDIVRVSNSSTKSSGKNLQIKKSVNAHIEDSSESTSSNNSQKCSICEKNCRRPSDCRKFKQLSQQERWNVVKKSKLCGKCLGKHDFRSCDLKKKCGTNGCEAIHHPLLHNFKKDEKNGKSKVFSSSTDTNVDSTSTSKSNQAATAEKKTVAVHQISERDVYFKIIPVILYFENKSINTYAFLDDGSEVTLIEEELALELGTVGIESSLCLRYTANQSRHEPSSRLISLQISGTQRDKRYTLPDLRTVEELALPSQTISRNEIVKKYSYLKNVPFPEMYEARPRILIGLNYAKLKMSLEVVVGEDDSIENPIAARTPLGWLVYGQNQDIKSSYYVQHHKFEICPCNLEKDEDLHQLFKEYSSVDSFGVSASAKCPESKEIEKAKRIMEDTTIRRDGRFETGLLWRYDNFQVPDSFSMAIKRLECTENKLRKTPDLLANVNNQIKDFITKGYIRKLNKNEIKSKEAECFYLPIFVALNPKKPSKVRIVWDAAAKVKGISLNSLLLTGPDLLSPLIDILRRFRERKIAISGDIVEMFHQIQIKEDDQHYQRFLWRDGDSSKEPEVYVMQVMTFGSTCSPSSAQYIKNLNASEFADKFQRAAFAITENHHVDDLLDSVDTVEEAIQLINDVRYIHEQGGFKIRNFLSNSKEVLAGIGQNSDGETKDLSICKDSEFEKILGMWWNTEIDEEDYFTYSLKFTKLDKDVVEGRRAPTKREVLRTLMTIFDPLGYLSHFLVYIKILLQDIWREKIDWDEPIPERLHKNWLTWFNLLPMVENVKIPRHYSPKLSKDNRTIIELHTFVDASIDAYCAVSYFRIEDENGVDCVLIGAKTKVAPQKPISIPRLELMATVLGARLTASLRKSHTLKIDKIFMWSDSMDALSWIHSDHRKYRQFVALRVGEVLELTDIQWWNFVPGKLNVADLGTKWTKLPNFEQSSSWFRGPEFLWQSKEKWPEQNLGKPTTTSELKANFTHSRINKPTPILPERFSKWFRCLRAQAYVFKFNNILKAKIRQRALSSSELTSEELRMAENVLYRLAQHDDFTEEISLLQRNKTISKSSSIFQCSPYLDESGVMRINGRIDNICGIKLNTKRPIILPRAHRITYLIVDHYHRKFLHQNHETVLNELRQNFYIPKLRVVLKQVRSKCQKCKNDRAKPAIPIMGDLPPARLAYNVEPFTYTGIDFFGPMYVLQNRKPVKRWGVIFTCLSVRAIHIEITPSLTASSCIIAVRNFMAYRGTPLEIYSDQGTNMKGANSELKKELAKLDLHQLSSEFVGPDLKWYFQPPASPHMSGSWERLIRSIKSNLNHIIPTRNPTEEILRNLLLEVMNIINSRPLTYVPVDSIDADPLTPNHFILGSSNGLKSGIFPVDDKTLLFGWKYAQQLINRFWKQWIRTYLPTLTRRTKWFMNVEPLQVGDVVIVVDEKNARNYWPKGIVVEVRPDSKGDVRSAVVQLVKKSKNFGKTDKIKKPDFKLLTRPVSKLAKLDVYKFDNEQERHDDVKAMVQRSIKEPIDEDEEVEEPPVCEECLKCKRVQEENKSTTRSSRRK